MSSSHSFRLAIATGPLRWLRAPLLLSLFVSIGSGSLASAQLINGSFESDAPNSCDDSGCTPHATIPGWSVDVAPPDLFEVEGGFIHVEYDDLFYDVPGGMPDDGSFFAHMKPDGDLSFTRLSQEFDALPGDEIKGAAFFFDGEFNVDLPDIPQDCFYADGMAVEIMAPGSVLVKRVYFAKHCPGTPYIPSEPSGFPIVDGSTPWTAWSYTFDGTEDMGPYTVRAQITNIGDNLFDSTSGLDGVELVLAPDSDGDGIPDYADNCLGDSNPTQANSDMDAFGDACP